MAGLHTCLTEQVGKLSCGYDLTKACLYMLERWDAFAAFSTTAASVLPTTAATAPFDASRVAVRHGCSAAPTAAASALPSSAP
jgi:hypothetical protein